MTKDFAPNYDILEDVYFNPKSRCLYDNTGLLIRESVLRRGKGGAFRRPKTPLDMDINKINPISINEPTIYSGELGGIWGHFIIEYCNRLWFTFYYPEYQHLNKYIILTTGIKPYHEYLINNTFLHNLKYLDNDNVVRFKQLYLPHSSFQIRAFSYEAHGLFFEYVSNSVSNNYETTCNILYLSRRKLPDRLRKIRYEDQIEKLVVNLGGTVIYPEQLSVEQQIKYINSSKIIMGCVGSAMHSILFRVNPDPYRVIVLANTKGRINKNYKLIDKVKNAKTTYVYGSLKYDLSSPKKRAAKDMIANMDYITTYLPRILKK